MTWLFEGLGTLLIGLVLGGTAGAVGGWKLAVRSVRQTQHAGNNAKQTQVGGDSSKRSK